METYGKVLLRITLQNMISRLDCQLQIHCSSQLCSRTNGKFQKRVFIFITIIDPIIHSVLFDPNCYRTEVLHDIQGKLAGMVSQTLSECNTLLGQRGRSLVILNSRQQEPQAKFCRGMHRSLRRHSQTKHVFYLRNLQLRKPSDIRRQGRLSAEMSNICPWRPRLYFPHQ